MIVIIGESASGKSTLQKLFVAKNPNFKKLITYTTRPKRKNEKDGVDYHFISNRRFDIMKDRGLFVEYATYNGWSYGTLKEDCKDENAVAVLTPSGFRALKREKVDLTSVYLYVDRRSRLISNLKRGDNIEEAYRRSLSDVGQYDGIIYEVDYVIDNTEFHMNEEQTLKCFENILSKAERDKNYENL